MRLLFTMTLMTVLFGTGVRSAVRADEPEDAITAKLKPIIDAKPLEPAKGDDDERKLLKERYNATVTILKVRHLQYLAGRIHVGDLNDSLTKVCDARLVLTDKSEERIAFLTLNLELAREYEKLVETAFKAGRGTEDDIASVRILRLDAELRLLREKRKADPSKK